MQSSSRATFYMTVFVTSISFFGMALCFPVMAPLFYSEPLYFDASSMPLSPSLMFGITVAAYPFAQFFGSKWLGRLSDRLGRKYTLQISVFFTVVGFLYSAMTLYYKVLSMFIVSRLFTGFFEGHIAIARAMASDLGDEIDKDKSFGYLNAAATSGYIAGPIVGGLMADQSIFSWAHPVIPFLFGALLCFIAFLLICFFVKETKQGKNTFAKEEEKEQHFLSITSVRYILMSCFCVTLSFDILYQFFPVLLVEKWQLDEFEIALGASTLSMFMILGQTYLIRIFKPYNRVTIMCTFTAVYTVVMATMSLFESHSSIFITFPILGICIGLSGTLVPVHASDQVSRNQQGQLMGVMMGYRSLGDAAICLVGAYFVTYDFKIPFFMGAAFMCVGILGLFLSSKHQYRKT